MRVYHADRVRTHGEAGTIEAGSVVVTDEGVLAWVGRTSQLPTAFAGIEATTVPGTLMPGFVDTHVHLGFDGGPEPVRRMQAESDAQQLVLMLRSARQLLSAGVTTARDLGARGYLDVVVREAIDSGDARGPRIVASGAPLTPTGGHCWFMGGEADGAYELRTAVRRHHENGVDSIKVMATGGFMTAGSAPWFAQFTDEELAFATADAHRLGKKVVAHAHGVDGIRAAVAAGVDAIEHCTFVAADGALGFDAQVADAIASAGVDVSFTQNVLSWQLARGEAPAVIEPHAVVDPRAVVEHFGMLIRELRSRGVTIVVGTDAGIDLCPHHAYAGGLEALASFGMTTEEVLIAATMDSARSLGLGGVTGALVEGLSADMIAVDGDPASDLTTVRRPTLVVARGIGFTPDPYPDLDDLPHPTGGLSLGAGVHH